ncbi:MAG: septal ring lytic transglycosylase RlpA family protein [Balneolaceae bacterium]
MQINLYYITLIILSIIFVASCGVSKRGTAIVSYEDAESGAMIENGIASWYGPKFHGKTTANGERYNMNGLTAAHKTLPFNTVVRVENVKNGRSVDVRINDRGPFVGNRIIDLSRKAAEEIDMIGSGTAEVRIFLLKEGDRKISTANTSSIPTFTVQLASFERRPEAERHSSQIDGTRVETGIVRGKTVYRVYYGVYQSSEAAKKAQRDLQRKGHNGFVKQIEN